MLKIVFAYVFALFCYFSVTFGVFPVLETMASVFLTVFSHSVLEDSYSIDLLCPRWLHHTSAH